MGLFATFEKILPSVTGKVFVITGTTSGTGFVAAQTAAKHGGEVVLLNRPSKRAEESLGKLQATVPEATFVPIACDLQDFDSVRKSAQEVLAKYDKIYCLANNAGIMATPDEATKDGYDTQMQTNHLSHFLLTAELFPLIVKGAKEYGDARIVQHSSGARNMTENGKLEEKYFGKNGGNLGGNEGGALSGPKMFRYAQTKLANSVFSQALHERLQAKEEYKTIRAVAAHPGFSRTSLGDHLYFGPLGFLITPILSYTVAQDAEDGAMGLIKGMMDPSAESGILYGPPRLSGKVVPHEPKPHESDDESKKMLWEKSEEATGLKFEI